MTTIHLSVTEEQARRLRAMAVETNLSVHQYLTRQVVDLLREGPAPRVALRIADQNAEPVRRTA